jgi:hypothetical protein
LKRLIGEAAIALGRIDDLRFDDQSVNEMGVRFLERLLDKGRHHDVALHIHILP